MHSIGHFWSVSCSLSPKNPLRNCFRISVNCVLATFEISLSRRLPMCSLLELLNEAYCGSHSGVPFFTGKTITSSFVPNLLSISLPSGIPLLVPNKSCGILFVFISSLQALLEYGAVFSTRCSQWSHSELDSRPSYFLLDPLYMT